MMFICGLIAALIYIWAAAYALSEVEFSFGYWWNFPALMTLVIGMWVAIWIGIEAGSRLEKVIKAKKNAEGRE